METQERNVDLQGPRRSLGGRLLHWFERWMPWHPAIVKFLLTLVGVSKEDIQSAPRSEQVVYMALALLMCLASASTGAGLSYKLGAAFSLGFSGHVVVFALATAFALLLEVVVIGTLSAKRKSIAGIALRVGLGCCLMGTQVLTILLIAFAPLIAAYQNDAVLDAAARARGKAAIAEDVDAEQKLTRELAQAEEQAQNEVNNPPANPKVTAATQRLEAAEKAAGAALKALDEARRRLAESQARLALEPHDSHKRDAIQKAIAYWQGQAAQRRSALNKAEADKTNAETDKDVAVKGWQTELQGKLADAQMRRIEQEAREKSATGKVAIAVTKAKKLAEDAAESRFLNDAAVLFKLMPTHLHVLFVSLFVMAVAMVVDLLPLVTKLQLAKGVVAKLQEDDADTARNRSDTAAYLRRNELIAQRLESDGKLNAMRLFTEQDGGASEASTMARRAQIAQDALAASHEALVLSEALEAVRAALQTALQLQAMAEKSPAVDSLYRQQLEALIRKLDAASTRLGRMGGMGGAAPNAA